jgi:hypothetical protein
MIGEKLAQGRHSAGELDVHGDALADCEHV